MTKEAGQPNQSLEAQTDYSFIGDRYSDVMKQYEYFLEWRHRVLDRFTILLSSLVLAYCFIKYSIPTESSSLPFAFPKYAAFFPSIATVFLAIFSYLMDRRNALIAAKCVEIGARYEELFQKMMISDGEGAHPKAVFFFTEMVMLNNDLLKYSNVLRALFIFVGLFGAGLAVWDWCHLGSAL